MKKFLIAVLKTAGWYLLTACVGVTLLLVVLYIFIKIGHPIPVQR